MAIVVEKIGRKEINCSRCKSLLSYSQEDVKEHKINFDYLGDYDIVSGIKCPVCELVLKDVGK